MDSVRDMIINKSLGPVEVSRGVQDLLNEYEYNKQVFDESYKENPLYALLKIMVYTKRSAMIIAKKNIQSFCWGNSAADNYKVYRLYMRDFQFAFDAFNGLFELNEAEKERLDDIRRRLVDSIAVEYPDNTSLMVDIFDTDSQLYTVEGIEYAR